MGLTVIGKVPRIKFNYLNNEDIVKFDEQFNKFYDRNNKVLQNFCCCRKWQEIIINRN